MRAGDLTEVISIWRRTGTRNEYGETTNSWACIAQCRAQRIMQNSRRALNNGELWYPRAAVFKTRLGVPVCEGDIIKNREQSYDVISVVEDRNIDLSITINTELHNE